MFTLYFKNRIVMIMESWIVGLIIMVVASYIIAKASNLFEVATDYLGRNMNDGVKGVTLNAIGSSFPELLTTVFFLVLATQENLGRDLAASVGGNTGSAIFNSIVIPMLVINVVLLGGAKSLNLSKKVILRDGIFLIVAELLLLVILSSNYITHWHGWILTGFYVVYIAYTLLTMSKREMGQESSGITNPESWYSKFIFKTDEFRTLKSWGLLLLAVTIIGVACAGLVEGCKIVAEALNINPLFIALVLVAAASSVPDTIISMKDARKGNHDDALSNVLASNIFDITISMGLPLAVYLAITGQRVPFAQEGSTLVDIRIMLVVITLVTVLIYYFSKKVNRWHVLAFGGLYLVFVFYAIGAAQYYAGGQGWLANQSGAFIEYLDQPGGINEALQKMSNAFGKGWAE